MFQFSVLAAALMAVSGAAHSTCFTVYGEGDKVVYRSSNAPVDLSRPLGEAVRSKFGPTATLISNDTRFDCPEAGTQQDATASSAILVEGARRSISTTAQPSAPLSHVPSFGRPEGSDFDFAGNSYGNATSAGHVLQTGPRGGQFYTNGNGNRAYVGSSGSRGGGRR